MNNEEKIYNINNFPSNLNNNINEKQSKKNNTIIWQILFIVVIVIVNIILAISYFDIDSGTRVLKNKVNEVTGNDSISSKQEKLQELKKNITETTTIINNYDKLKKELETKITKITTENKKLNSELSTKNSELKTKTNTYNSLQTKYRDMTTHVIRNIITYNQYPKYPNGCEAVALYILLKYHNVNVDIESVMDALPKGRTPYKKDGVDYGGDPNYEFLGDPRSITGWGIYDIGLAETANKFKANIINGTGMDFSKVISLVDTNRPVVVWTSINLMDSYISKRWISDKTGKTINWKRGNHAVVVIGYNDNSIVVSDPIDGKIKYFNRQKFINMYNYMGRRALYY